MQIEWQIMDWVEAQVFKPDTPSRSAILFCPGFPGAGSVVFEQRHAGALTQYGYDVYVIHHKGTRTMGGSAPSVINNSIRLQRALNNNEEHIGGGPATIDDWMIEPFVALKQLSSDYANIHIVANSYGALSSLWSLTQPEAAISNVRSILFYAGAQGIDDGTDNGIMRIFKEEFINLPRITEKVTLNPAKEIVETLKNVYKELPQRVTERLPETISLTYLIVEKDEILRVSDTEAFNKAIGDRGRIVMDTVDHAWPDQGLWAHDTPNFRTKDLIELIRG